MAEAQRQGLPPKPFMYTIDQVAYLLQLDEDYLKKRIIHFDGRSVGAPTPDEIVAYNMAAPNDPPMWRIPERRLVGYMRRKGMRYHERGYVN